MRPTGLEKKAKVISMRAITILAIAFTFGNLTVSGQAGQPQGPPTPTPTPVASGPTSKWTDEAARKRLNELLASRPVAQSDEQANQSSQTIDLPKWLSYESYFEHIAGIDKLAAELEAKGKDGKPWRTFEQHQTGLTDEEGATLKKAAYDCNQAVKDIDAKMYQVKMDFHNQHPSQSYRYQPPPEIEQLWADRQQVIEAHIDELRGDLSVESFQRLDSHVHTLYGVSKRVGRP
jgi:hypothetical protein